MSEPVSVATTTTTAARGRHAWIERLQRFAQSGLTPPQFCAQENVSLPTFYSWRRRLATNTASQAEQAAGGNAASLLAVRLAAPAAGLELALPTGAVLRIPPGADEGTLRCLLRLLEVLPC
jgi:transposase